MQSQRITGGGGAQLHVVEAGNARGRPIFWDQAASFNRRLRDFAATV